MRPFVFGNAKRAAATFLLSAAAGSAAVVAPAPASAAPCAAVDVVVARGTAEPGTLGLIVGDPVYSAFQKKATGKTTGSYRVDYPADLSIDSVETGNADLVAHVTAQAAACPAQKFVLVGYSQGANVVDNSIGISSEGALVGGRIVATIPAALAPRVKAVLLFGNPIRAIGRRVTGPYALRTLDLCAAGDPVCQAGGNDVGAHLSYFANADAAAAFAAARV